MHERGDGECGNAEVSHPNLPVTSKTMSHPTMITNGGDA